MIFSVVHDKEQTKSWAKHKHKKSAVIGHESAEVFLRWNHCLYYFKFSSSSSAFKSPCEGLADFVLSRIINKFARWFIGLIEDECRADNGH